MRQLVLESVGFFCAVVVILSFVWSVNKRECRQIFAFFSSHSWRINDDACERCSMLHNKWGQNDDRLPWTAAKYFMFSAVRIISKMQHIFIKEMWIYVFMSSRTTPHSGRINRRDSKWDGTSPFHAMKILDARPYTKHWTTTVITTATKEEKKERNKSDERKLYTHLSTILFWKGSLCVNNVEHACIISNANDVGHGYGILAAIHLVILLN